MTSLEGRVVAVTGAARGIGLETAKALIGQGALVAIGDVDRDALAEAANLLGPKALAHRLDVTDRGSFIRFLDATEEAFGPIDVLINNAGIMPAGPFVDESDALARKQVEVNLLGVVLGMKLAIVRMVPRGGGQVINVSSLAGMAPSAGIVTYTGTKFAVVGLTEAAHYEYHRDGMVFSTILPGFVDTALTSGVTPSRLVQVLQPEDVADAIVHAVRTGRSRVVRPRSLGALAFVRPFLPMPARRLVARVTGIDRVFLDLDEQARDDYTHRISA